MGSRVGLAMAVHYLQADWSWCPVESSDAVIPLCSKRALGAPQSRLTIRTLKVARKEVVGELVPEGKPNPDLLAPHSRPFQGGSPQKPKGPLPYSRVARGMKTQRTRGTNRETHGKRGAPELACGTPQILTAAPGCPRVPSGPAGPGGPCRRKRSLSGGQRAESQPQTPSSLCPTAVPAQGFSLPARLCPPWALCDPGPPILPAETRKQHEGRKARSRDGGGGSTLQPLTLSPSSPGPPGGPAGPGSPMGPWAPSRPAGPRGPFSPWWRSGKLRLRDCPPLLAPCSSLPSPGSSGSPPRLPPYQKAPTPTHWHALLPSWSVWSLGAGSARGPDGAS